MEIRSIIEMLLAIDCLVLSIEQYRLSKKLRDLTNNVVYLTFKDLNKEVKNNEIEFAKLVPRGVDDENN